MVDSHYVIELIAVRNPLNPPRILRFFMIIPFIKRIPPKLSRCGKSVRRTSGHTCGPAVFIQLEQLWICPRVRAVKGHINRDIPDNLHTLVIGILFQFPPLCIKQVLLKFIKKYLLFQLFRVFFDCFRFPEPDVPVPFRPAFPLVRILHRHIKGIIRKPERILRHKSLKIFVIFKPAVIKSLLQYPKTGLVNFFIIHICFASAPVALLTLFFRK